MYTLYNTLILPHFYYGVLLGGTNRIGYRALRIVTNSKYNAHTEPICKTWKILRFSDLYDLQLYKLYFKIKVETVLQYLTTTIPTLNHTYSTRREAV